MVMHRAKDVIREMNDNANLDGLLERTGLSAFKILSLLRTREGKQQLKARRQLAKIHSRLLAERYSPFAVKKLTGLLGDEQKPEMHFKSALALLALAGLGGKGGSGAKKGESSEEPTVDMDPEYRKELMLAMAAALTEMRRQRREAEDCHRRKEK